jgi:hypothetical protein
MSDEAREFVPPLVAQHPAEALTPAALENAALIEAPLIPPDQVHAVESYFQQDQESRTVAGLFGLWTSAVLLTDLATEHFSPPANEDEARDEDEPEEAS